LFIRAVQRCERVYKKLRVELIYIHFTCRCYYKINQLLYWFCLSIDTYRDINKRGRLSLKTITVSQLFNKFSTSYRSRNSSLYSLPTASFYILLEINTGDSLLFIYSTKYFIFFFLITSQFSGLFIFLKFSYQKLVYTLSHACYMPCQPILSTNIKKNFAEEQNLSSLLRV
jgi:hypothetical protein